MEEKENIVVSNEDGKVTVEKTEVKKVTMDIKPYVKYIVMLGVVALIFVGGCQLGEKRMQDSAIRYGAGEYYADATGKTHFRFIKAKDAEANVVATDTAKVIIEAPVVEAK